MSLSSSVSAQPQKRVLENTELMLNAAVNVLAQEGIAHFNLSRVSKYLGKSLKIVRDRVKTPEELLLITWKFRLAPLVLTKLETLRAAVRDVENPKSRESFLEICEYFVSDAPEVRALAEVLVISYYTPSLRAAIDQTFAEHGFASGNHVENQDEKLRLAFAKMLVLGLMLNSRSPRALAESHRDGLLLRWFALTHLAQAQPRLGVPADHMDVEPVLDENDSELNLLLQTTLRLVSERGFNGVTVVEIAKASGHSEGYVFARYQTKLELYQDATRRQMAVGFALNEKYWQEIEKLGGMGRADAEYYIEALKPHRNTARIQSLEQLRLAWHDAGMFLAATEETTRFREALLEKPHWAEIETESDFFLNICLGQGALLLPVLFPTAHELAWDRVTVPLWDAMLKRAESN
jgi:AcrR family transcriptional regulator